ncbi:superoxide mitochondrial precursor [Grosmannia clavigera kw1407]|uniref:Superoxide dismutase n=1 Tax=Grosmannia clavigera (strain kw1407 / UAMH 11150) TaxID=655863 RepID=F0XQZ7_GROCL|nr:superoxide mitochondrial precursor [Grosmannia clavigera kw1407]EFW99793.1 superoxide mitochondrial precursor [Grosmannia clavigera kw1407]
MTLHHDRHHQAYITNLNAVLADYYVAASQGHIADQTALQASIHFNGGGHINHALFWPTLAPASSADACEPEAKAPRLLAALGVEYGSLDNFSTTFSSTLLSVQGSGWGWLVRSGCGVDGRLLITTTKDQDPVVRSIAIGGQASLQNPQTRKALCPY